MQVFSDNVTEVNFRPEQGHSMGPAEPVPQLSLGDMRKDLVFLDFASDPDFAHIQQVLAQPRPVTHVCAPAVHAARWLLVFHQRVSCCGGVSVVRDLQMQVAWRGVCCGCGTARLEAGVANLSAI